MRSSRTRLNPPRTFGALLTASLPQIPNCAESDFRPKLSECVGDRNNVRWTRYRASSVFQMQARKLSRARKAEIDARSYCLLRRDIITLLATEARDVESNEYIEITRPGGIKRTHLKLEVAIRDICAVPIVCGTRISPTVALAGRAHSNTTAAPPRSFSNASAPREKWRHSTAATGTR